MKRPPFKMLSSRSAALICNGRFLTGGRASFVWETFLMRRASGVPGVYEIRLSGPGHHPKHRLNWTVKEAELALAEWGPLAHRRVKRARRFRESRSERGLPVE